MDKKIPLMLDTSVLKQVPKLDSLLFSELVRYTKAGIYKLYISEVVEMEYLTWIREQAQDAYNTVNRATQSLNKYYEEPTFLNIKPSFNVTSFVAGNQINSIYKKVVENWEKFKSKTSTTVLPIEDHHGSEVMKAYFNGDIPFKNVKNRTDIPDAFIYLSLNSIDSDNSDIIFVSADSSLRERVQANKIICFESLSELFSKGPGKLDEKFFSSLDSQNKFHTLLKLFEDEIYRKLIWEIEISDTESDLDEYKDTAIGEFEESNITARNIILDKDNIKRISENSLLVPFAADVRCTIESIAKKDEVLFLDDFRLKRIEREVTDDGDFKITEYYDYTISGHFSLTFDDSDPSTWKEQKSSDKFWSSVEIKEIGVELEDYQKHAQQDQQQ